MTYFDLLKVKKGHTHNIYTSGLIRFYFYSNLSHFDIFMTIYDHYKIIFPYFLHSDLSWPRKGQTRSHKDEFFMKFAS